MAKRKKEEEQRESIVDIVKLLAKERDIEEEEIAISYYGLFDYANIEECLDIIAKDAKEAGEDAEEPAFKRLLV